MAIALRVLFVVIAAAIISLGLVVLARATRARHNMRGTEDVETAYISAVSTLYGIFIAFMIFTVWTRYNEAVEATDIEASTIADMYQMAGGLPQPTRHRLQGLTVDYAHSVARDEWRTMLSGRPSGRTEAVVREVWILFNGMASESVRDPVLRDHLLASWERLSDQRRVRLLRARSGLTEYAYALLVIGGLITLGIACVFTVDDFWTHALKASALGCLIGLMLVTIWGLDHPFSSHIRIQPQAFDRVIDMLQVPR